MDNRTSFCDVSCQNNYGHIQEALTHLRANHYDAAAMDLLYGECSLALSRAMAVPVVGFWAASPATGMLHFTTQPSNPSFMPFFVTGFSDRMSFAERLYNAGLWDGECLLNCSSV